SIAVDAVRLADRIPSTDPDGHVHAEVLMTVDGAPQLVRAGLHGHGELGAAAGEDGRSGLAGDPGSFHVEVVWLLSLIVHRDGVGAGGEGVDKAIMYSVSVAVTAVPA